jgi:hypothetical protein
MPPQHYLIFHPDRARTKTRVQANALIGDQLIDWQGHVWVDNPSGNEDPFVFSQSWLYSYCHATQIRRTPRPNSEYVSTGSYLFFCSGDAANEGAIQLDTVFVVDHVATWPANQQGLPEEFKEHYRNNSSDLWQRHFRYPFYGSHEGKYTYVSRQQCDRTDGYSFLPIAKSGDRVSFELDALTRDLRQSISEKITGKRPVPVREDQKTELLTRILSLTEVQVIGGLTREADPKKRTSHPSGACGASLPFDPKC